MTVGTDSQRPGADRLRMEDPHREPQNRSERRARQAWLKKNAPRGMTPEQYLEHLKSLAPDDLARELNL